MENKHFEVYSLLVAVNYHLDSLVNYYFKRKYFFQRTHNKKYGFAGHDCCLTPS